MIEIVDMKKFISAAHTAGAAEEKVTDEEPQSVLLPLVTIELIIALLLLLYVD